MIKRVDYLDCKLYLKHLSFGDANVKHLFKVWLKILGNQSLKFAGIYR